MRILVVEDDGGSRGILQEHLAARGWEVLSAADPAMGQRLLEQSAPELVLTDIHLPGANGADHVRRFCAGAGGRQPVVVAMTGYPSPETCLECLAAGAAGYLVKPFRVTEFVELAERALAERRTLGRVGELEARVAELESELARLRVPPPERDARSGRGTECR